MKLVESIIEILSSEKPNLADALIKTKVVLHKLGEKQLVEWVNSELNGYHDGAVLPDYRVVGSLVKADIMNVAYSANNVDVPVYHLDEEVRQSLETSAFRQGIAAIEDLASGDSSSVQRPIPHVFYGLLSKEFASGYSVQSAWCEIPKHSLIQILTQVRSRLLDFILELSEKVSDSDDSTDLKRLSKEIGTESLFNNAVFGHNATIVVGNHNIQNIESSVRIGDFDSLANFLKKNQVGDADISELLAAVSQDQGSESHNERKYGPGVKGWFQKMVGKAVDGTWTIGAGAAGNVLATAINSFYGWI